MTSGGSEVTPAGAAVVALGGGHGLHASLSALRRVVDDLTAVVTVAPIMMITSSAAASGVSPGLIFNSHGRMRPRPPNNSHTPMKSMNQ